MDVYHTLWSFSGSHINMSVHHISITSFYLSIIISPLIPYMKTKIFNIYRSFLPNPQYFFYGVFKISRSKRTKRKFPAKIVLVAYLQDTLHLDACPVTVDRSLYLFPRLAHYKSQIVLKYFIYSCHILIRYLYTIVSPSQGYANKQGSLKILRGMVIKTINFFLF